MLACTPFLFLPALLRATQRKFSVVACTADRAHFSQQLQTPMLRPEAASLCSLAARPPSAPLRLFSLRSKKSAFYFLDLSPLLAVCLSLLIRAFNGYWAVPVE